MSRIIMNSFIARFADYLCIEMKINPQSIPLFYLRASIDVLDVKVFTRQSIYNGTC